MGPVNTPKSGSADGSLRCLGVLNGTTALMSAIFHAALPALPISLIRWSITTEMRKRGVPLCRKSAEPKPIFLEVTSTNQY